MPLIDDEVRITLRLPESLRDRTAAAAKTSGRSLNSEIVAALEQAFPDRKVQLNQALRVIDEQIDEAPQDKRPELVRLRQQLAHELAAEWFEPFEGDE